MCKSGRRRSCGVSLEADFDEEFENRVVEVELIDGKGLGTE
mgnify:CR=1 FL=1